MIQIINKIQNCLFSKLCNWFSYAFSEIIPFQIEQNKQREKMKLPKLVLFLIKSKFYSNFKLYFLSKTFEYILL